MGKPAWESWTRIWWGRPVCKSTSRRDRPFSRAKVRKLSFACFAPGVPTATTVVVLVDSFFSKKSVKRPSAGASPSTMAAYRFRARWALNCSVSRAAALLVRAKTITPPTGRSSRWTRPK